MSYIFLFCRLNAKPIADLLVSTKANVLFELGREVNTFCENFHQLFLSTLPKIKELLKRLGKS